jgi:hypothetical protein
MDKNAIKIISGVIILGGAYLVIRSLMKKNDSGIAPLQPIPNTPTPNTPTPSTPTPSAPIVIPPFPIKKGDRDNGAPLNPVGKVVSLQKLINQKGYVPLTNRYVSSTIKLVEDGIFGNKTEEALMYWVNKKSIDNQSDLNYLNNKINPSIDSFVK